MSFQKVLLLASILMLSIAKLSAEDKSNPLEPNEVSPPKEIGVVLGLGMNLQAGTSLSDCPECFFEDGNKFGLTIGLVYEQYLSGTDWKWGVMGLYDDLGVNASFREREAFEFVPDKFVPVNFRHKSEISISQLSAVPYIKWAPTSFYFLKVGPNISYILSSNLLHTKEILDKSTLLPTGETVSISFPDSKSKETTIIDDEYPETKNLQYGLSLMTGFNFESGYNFVFSPYFIYNIPFRNVSDFGKDLKISSWRLMFEFRMKI